MDSFDLRSWYHVRMSVFDAQNCIKLFPDPSMHDDHFKLGGVVRQISLAAEHWTWIYFKIEGDRLTQKQLHEALEHLKTVFPAEYEEFHCKMSATELAAYTYLPPPHTKKRIVLTTNE